MKRKYLLISIIILVSMIELCFVPAVFSAKPVKTDTIPWGIDRIDADNVWNTNKGTGIKVAVIDTGVDIGHPDLDTSMGINFVGTEDPNNYDDTHGHGTMIAGIISARKNGIGVVGVGPEIQIYSVRVRPKSGIVYPDDYPNHTEYNFTDLYEGMRWCIDNDMQVISFSLGIWTIEEVNSTPQHKYPLHDHQFYNLINEAYNKGIVLVAAAGNGVAATNNNGRRIGIYNDPDTHNDVVFESLEYDFPASYPEIIAVSATEMKKVGKNRGDYLASFISNYGPAISLAAPGVSIYST